MDFCGAARPPAERAAGAAEPLATATEEDATEEPPRSETPQQIEHEDGTGGTATGTEETDED